MPHEPHHIIAPLLNVPMQSLEISDVHSFLQRFLLELEVFAPGGGP